MRTYPKGKPPIRYAPTKELDVYYPDSDGEPIAASDLHRDQLIWLLQALETHFAAQLDVYISGDILMYYEKGNPRRVVAPDVLVTLGIRRGQRRTYKVWEEGKPPDFVMEFSSKSTYENDLSSKRELYAELGIRNYILYDAEGLYLPAPLMGFERVDGAYVDVPLDTEGGLHASVLGLDFRVLEDGLSVYDPVAGAWLQTPAEAAAARAAQEALARRTAETRAEQAEAEAKELREQLARLQTLR